MRSGAASSSCRRRWLPPRRARLGSEAHRGRGHGGKRHRVVRRLVRARDGHRDDAAHEAAEMRQEAARHPSGPSCRGRGRPAWAPAPPARPASGRWPRPPAGLCPPSSHSSEPGASRRDSGPLSSRCMRAGQRTSSSPRSMARIGDAQRSQPQRRGDGGAGVADLVLADQRRQRQVQQPLGALEDEAAALLEGLVVLAPHESGAPTASARVCDDLQRLGRLARRRRRARRP